MSDISLIGITEDLQAVFVGEVVAHTLGFNEGYQRATLIWPVEGIIHTASLLQAFIDVSW